MLAQVRCSFEVCCRRNLVTGTTAAFCRELLALALPLPLEWVHDEWRAACAAAWKTVAMLPDRLTLYRQHGRNAIGVPTSRLSRLVNYVRRVLEFPRDEYLMRNIARFAALHRRFHETSVARADALALLSESEQHFLRRRSRTFLVTLYSGSYRSCAKRGPVAISVLRTVPQAWSETLFTASRSGG
ncbi:hypothetical protein [Paraburkholderia phosphatilytica]|uniref:hypothetical protein n=1 Tax=Paraburkholderia phosphatilytica TaxID=2282883 RepID=UPI001F0CD3CD|nr:hypothetical protein [Paraburkholderia phosphatilytica]